MTYSIKDRLGVEGRWISGIHTQTRPLIWLRGHWTLVVDVHIIFLAGQSSPILALHNGAAGDTRCFSRLHSERQGHPDKLNWIDLSLFGLCSAGLPSPGLHACESSPERDEKGRKNWQRVREETCFPGGEKTHQQWNSYDITFPFLKHWEYLKAGVLQIKKIFWKCVIMASRKKLGEKKSRNLNFVFF